MFRHHSKFGADRFMAVIGLGRLFLLSRNRRVVFFNLVAIQQVGQMALPTTIIENGSSLQFANDAGTFFRIPAVAIVEPGVKISLQGTVTVADQLHQAIALSRALRHSLA